MTHTNDKTLTARRRLIEYLLILAIIAIAIWAMYKLHWPAVEIEILQQLEQLGSIIK